jgi:hypothetical protein
MDDCRTVVAPVTIVAAIATAVRPEDEPGEEDHGDDEHYPRDDAHPGGDKGRLGAPRLLVHNGLRG